MENFEEDQENYNRAVNKMNEAIDKLAESLSSNIRNKKDKTERVTLLKNLNNVPSNRVLKKVNEIATKNEDYETCDAIKEFCDFKGIVL